MGTRGVLCLVCTAAVSTTRLRWHHRVQLWVPPETTRVDLAVLARCVTVFAALTQSVKHRSATLAFETLLKPVMATVRVQERSGHIAKEQVEDSAKIAASSANALA